MTTTSITPDERSPAPTDDRPVTQRVVESITGRLGRASMGRRSFLSRVAVLGSALAVDPVGFLLKPNTAWATVCGDDAEFADGWSAFCATINDGANTCPSGSYPAGWWKIDNTTFCKGRARYIVDCNRSPGASCNCHAADGECDHRRVCCNNFRYGQCNTHIRGTTEVVCRIVLCTPPWEWGNCTTTSLTSNQTRTHWSARLPSRTNPTAITIRWLDMGLAGSVLGDMVGSERRLDDGGSWARFDNGVLARWPNTISTRILTGDHGARYRDLGGPGHWLGYPYNNATDNPARVRYQRGHAWRTPDGVFVTTTKLGDYYYNDMGGPSGWMGDLTGDVQAPGPWTMSPTESGWWAVHSSRDDVTRAMRSASGLPSNGQWPDLAQVHRWTGDTSYETAAAISQNVYPNGSDAVVVVSGEWYPDAVLAGAVAARLGAPILLARRTGLPRATADELRRLSAARGIIIGNYSAILGSTGAEIQDLVGDLERWAGEDRYATAVEVSRQAFPEGSDAVVVFGNGSYPGSLVAGPLAHQLGAPMLWVERNRIPVPMRHELRRLDPSRAIIIGDEQAVSANIAAALRDNYGLSTTRHTGSNRYEIAARIAAAMGGTGGNAVIVNRNAFPDGLAANSYAATRGWPIFPVRHGIHPAVDDELRRRRPEHIVIVGPRSGVHQRREDQLEGYRT